MAYKSINGTFLPREPSSAKVLQSEVFISTAVVDVMTGVDGLGGK